MSEKIGVLYGEANASTSGGTRRIDVTRYAGHGGPWLQFTPEGNNGFLQVNERELRELLGAPAVSDCGEMCGRCDACRRALAELRGWLAPGSDKPQFRKPGGAE